MQGKLQIHNPGQGTMAWWEEIYCHLKSVLATILDGFKRRLKGFLGILAINYDCWLVPHPMFENSMAAAGDRCKGRLWTLCPYCGLSRASCHWLWKTACCVHWSGPSGLFLRFSEHIYINFNFPFPGNPNNCGSKRGLSMESHCFFVSQTHNWCLLNGCI